MNLEIQKPTTETQIQQYEKDGSICFRGQFDDEWCATC